nr:hypothetical protein [Tanacetum cinerariifolium]
MLKQHVKQRKQAANLAVQKKQEEYAAQSFTPYWNFSMIDDEELLQAREKFMKSTQTFLQKFSRYPFGLMPKVLLIAWERFSEIKHAFTDKQYQPEEIQELMCKLLEDVRNINEEFAEYINSPSWDRPAFYDDDDAHSIQYKEYLENSSNAIAPVLPTEEPDNSLSMGDEHLSTIPKTKSDEVIKSSVENLVPIPSEFEVTSDNESECDVPVNDESSPIFMTFSNILFDCNDDFTSSDDELLSNEDIPMENFKIYSNPLFDEEIISTKIDPHYFNAESNLIESLLNRDTLIDSSPKFDYLLELAHINLIPPGIEEADFNLEEEICLVENLSYDNSPPRPPKELNAEIVDTIVESLYPSPIPVEDGDSHIEEIDLYLATNDLMPPDIESDDYDSEGDVNFLEELLRELISAMMNNIDELIEDVYFNPGGGEFDIFAKAEDDDYFPFIFVL